MPSINTPDSLSAIIGFTLPPDRLDHDDSLYLKYDPSIQRPNEKIRVPMTNLREVLEHPVESVQTSLGSKGYALMRHQSDLLDSIPSEEGTSRYLDQCCELLKQELACTRVVTWNSVCRRNEPEKIKLKHVERQQAPEKGFIPTSRLQPVAGFAHVDQDAEWGEELCSRAARRPASEFKRCQIINIWRPLNGPVTNAPLGVIPFHSLRPESIATHGHLFGTGHDIHHHPTQEWAYVRHQMPDEIIFLKCYDSQNPYFQDGPARRGGGEMRGEGDVPFCGHVAIDVGEQDELSWEEGGGRARESIEVRLVALWE